MDSGNPARPAEVRIAVGAALVVAALLFVGLALSIVFAVYAVSHPADIIGVLVWVSFVVDVLIAALALGFATAARRLARGDPRALRQVALGTGAASTVGAVFVATDGLVHGYPANVPALVALVVVAALFVGLAVLPTRGAGRAWVATRARTTTAPAAPPAPAGTP